MIGVALANNSSEPVRSGSEPMATCLGDNWFWFPTYVEGTRTSGDCGELIAAVAGAVKRRTGDAR